MIVKLVRAVVEETGRGSPDASTWLQMGEEYVVLSVDVTWRDVNNNWIDLQIHNPDEASPYDWGYWSIHHFEVTSAAIPSNWTIQPMQPGFALIPAAWMRPWHWDHLGDADAGSETFTREERDASAKQAWADYRRERDVILAEAGFATT